MEIHSTISRQTSRSNMVTIGLLMMVLQACDSTSDTEQQSSTISNAIETTQQSESDQQDTENAASRPSPVIAEQQQSIEESNNHLAVGATEFDNRDLPAIAPEELQAIEQALENQLSELQAAQESTTQENQRLIERIQALEAQVRQHRQLAGVDAVQTRTSAPRSRTTQPQADFTRQLETTSTSNRMSEADQFFANLTDADIGYSVPNDMEAGVTEMVELVLGVDTNQAELEAELSADAQISFDSVQVSPVVEARLTGQNFEISAITEEKQPVSTARKTRWEWQVTPLVEGKHKLHLSLGSTVMVDNNQTPVTLRTFNREIAVSVDPMRKIKNFLSNNWQWLWSAIFIPIAGFIWARRKRSVNQE